MQNGVVRQGQVLEIDEDKAMVQLFEGSAEINLEASIIRFSGRSLHLPVSEDMIGRVFNGMGKIMDDGPEIIAEKHVDIDGHPINPVAQVAPDYPDEFIQTGISAIDHLKHL